MGPDGYCTVCPGKCYWNVHFNQKYRWEYQQFKEKLSVEELIEKYLKDKEVMLPVQMLMECLKDEYEHVQAEVEKVIERSAKYLNRLRAITQNPDRLSTLDYINLLIKGEKQEAKEGWKQRVQSLEAIREKVENITKIEIVNK